MGFYQPAQIVRDAREHGVEVRPVCINASRWDCTLEPTGDESRLAVRLGLRMVKGLANAHAAAIVAARGDENFTSIADLWRRAGVPVAALDQIAAADGFRPAFGLARREAQWAIKGLRDEELPLFAAASDREGRTVPELDEPAIALRAMPAGREVVEDYGHIGLSLRRHPVSFLREDLAKRRIVSCAEAMAARDRRWLEAAGIVLVRQRPGSANGVMFVTLEDETGIAQSRRVARPLRPAAPRTPGFTTDGGLRQGRARGRGRAPDRREARRPHAAPGIAADEVARFPLRFELRIRGRPAFRPWKARLTRTSPLSAPRPDRPPTAAPRRRTAASCGRR